MKQILNFNLYEFLTEKIINRFEKHMDLTQVERDKLYYGVISVLMNIIKGIIILSIAIYFGIFKEILIMTVIVAMIRLTSAGLHAKSNLMCTLTTLITYIGGTLLSIHYPVEFNIAFMICIGLTILVFIYSPADTENRPIIGKEKRKKLKFQTLVMAIIILAVSLLILNTTIINLTMFAMLFQTISILPCTYKILKRSWANYEKYEQKPTR